ncbi:protoporphyrinogen oxidase [Longispora albida]|uniref:protoporphyrinogen oxidase n=1 Tax=Longispora albida TaxID=203523 RepID=UPI0003727DE4|nr:protoporphyrinogen oxidase [Longispora albida]
MAHVVVIGGGIAGLTAAYRLRQRDPGCRITLIEQAPEPGGKLRAGSLAGVRVEAGAEAFLVRDPAVADLAAELGLAVVHPARVPAALALGGRLLPIPAGTLVGVPADTSALGDVATATPEPATTGPLLAAGQDVSVGELVRARYGSEVVDRLVDPMLGGVYAGRADGLSLATTLPTLAAAARTHDTLAGAVRAALGTSAGPATGLAAGAGAAPSPKPIFGTIEGGMSALVSALVDAAGADLRLGLPVRGLHRTASGWRLVIGATRSPETLEADAVILAVPARPAARLLHEVSPEAAAEVGVLDYASVALVALALPGVVMPELSGFLVPAPEGFATKAVTFIDQKWPHLAAPDLALVRASVGRYGDERVLQRPDGDLVSLVRTELAVLLGRDLPVPVDATVRRWGGALPQYAPGHLDRVRRAREALAGLPLALAGAAYDGVGIPACVRSAGRAAEQILH